MSNEPRFRNINFKEGRVRCHVDFSRLESAYDEAQYNLDWRAFEDTTKYMPQSTGNFIATARMTNQRLYGTGKIVVGQGKSAHYLWEGELYVDPYTKKGNMAHSGRRRIPSGRPLTFHEHAQWFKTFGVDGHGQYFYWRSKGGTPSTIRQPHWFDASKQDNIEKWVKLVKRTIRNGRATD